MKQEARSKTLILFGAYYLTLSRSVGEGLRKKG